MLSKAEIDVSLNAAVDMVEFSLFDNGKRLASTHAAVDTIVKMDSSRPNGGIPLVEIRFNEPEAALRLARAALDIWLKWKSG